MNIEEMTADMAYMIDVAAEGAKAGYASLAASMNPHPKGSKEFDIWERARIHALALKLYRCADFARRVA